MARAKRTLKVRRPSKVLSVAGIAGGAFFASSTSGSVADIPPQSTAPFQVLHLGEEEISDVSLATFYVFDKENTGPPQLAQKLRVARCGRGCGCGRGGACGGCGGCAGCGGGGGNTNGGCGGGVDNYP